MQDESITVREPKVKSSIVDPGMIYNGSSYEFLEFRIRIQPIPTVSINYAYRIGKLLKTH